MAVVLAIYVTDRDLAGGAYGESYGFEVSETGVGSALFDIDAAVGSGSAEALFGTGTSSVMSVLAILTSTDAQSSNGVVFDTDGDGTIDAREALLRTLANDLFTAINETGDIG